MTVRAAGESAFGVMVHRQLKLIHQMLRSDLAVCRELAAEVAGGAPAERVAAELTTLQARSPIWRLQVNCLYHCQVVHAHHHHEDAGMFPALRHSNPDLAPVIDRLEADHRAISPLLDAVEAATADLDDSSESRPARARLVEGLNALADHLLTHLAYEEEAIAVTMRSWDRWPEI